MMMDAMKMGGKHVHCKYSNSQFTTFHDTLRMTASFDSREESTTSSATISGTESEKYLHALNYNNLPYHQDS